MDSHNDNHAESDLKTGLMGLGIGLVWVALVMGFAHWLAL